MKLYSANDSYKLYSGNMLDMLDVIHKNTIDSIVTDPPYELNFMGKGWDNSGIAFQRETWERCLEVLRPGGYLLAFGGSRTFHRIACAIEDAGFEIRDTIMWMYGSGFPKSMNIGLSVDKKQGNERIKTGRIIYHAQKGCTAAEERGEIGAGAFGAAHYEEETIGTSEWEGWGTALKPSYEPIIVARKPCEGSCTENVLKYGVGGININECRIGEGSWKEKPAYIPNKKNKVYFEGMGGGKWENTNGRFPSNTILTYDEADEEEVCGGMIKDDVSAARYFYCAKASKKDRNDGLNSTSKNIHPTVKPTELMQYLIRLVTPKGGTILDPFNGSGSTGKAAMWENRERNKDYKYIGIELTETYLPIARARIEFVKDTTIEIEDQVVGQINIFDFAMETMREKGKRE